MVPKSDKIILADLVGMEISTSEMNKKLLEAVIIGSDKKVIDQSGHVHDFNNVVVPNNLTD